MLSSFLHLKEGECKFVKRMRDEYDFVNVLRAVGLVLRMPNSIDQKFGYVWNFKCPYLYENKEFFLMRTQRVRINIHALCLTAR